MFRGLLFPIPSRPLVQHIGSLSTPVVRISRHIQLTLSGRDTLATVMLSCGFYPTTSPGLRYRHCAQARHPVPLVRYYQPNDLPTVTSKATHSTESGDAVRSCARSDSVAGLCSTDAGFNCNCDAKLASALFSTTAPNVLTLIRVILTRTFYTPV
jgi:hypothetical protein